MTALLICGWKSGSVDWQILQRLAVAIVRISAAKHAQRIHFSAIYSNLHSPSALKTHRMGPAHKDEADAPSV